jgi:uncharacterized protein YlzI (FlbEa/FlbD family)
MIKLTRLDHKTVAINPDHIVSIEANPDTTLSLLGDRKVIVREALDEVVERFITVKAKMGCSAVAVQLPTPTSNSRHPPSNSSRPSFLPPDRSSMYPSAPPPKLVDDEGGY